MKEQMTWTEIRDRARELLKPQCLVCPVCNGRACVGKTPGNGGKGSGKTFQRNYDYLHDHIRFQMNVLGENFIPDLTLELFGRRLSLPVLAAPIGMVAWNLSDTMDDKTYSDAIIEGMLKAGSLAMTGGGKLDENFLNPLASLREHHGEAVFNIKPWTQEKILEQVNQVAAAGAPAFVVDIDSAGLPQAKSAAHLMDRKNRQKLAEIAKMSDMKFIVKGVMTPEAATEAAEAGVYGIVVSNHGGRVIDEGLSTAEVLPSIRNAVGNRVKVLVDGGVRNGYDVFKMLALGADALLIGRPYTWAVYGGGAEGVELFTEQLKAELKDIMNMTGCAKLSDIDMTKIKIVD